MTTVPMFHQYTARTEKTNLINPLCISALIINCSMETSIALFTAITYIYFSKEAFHEKAYSY